MIADNLAIAQIMMLVNQAVVEGFKAGMAHGFEPDRAELGEFCLQGSLIDFINGNRSVAFVVMGAGKPWWQSDEAFSVKGEQNLSASHILELAIGLTPVPMPAKDLGDMLSALIPMGVNGGLNGFKRSLVNGSFADGDGQHVHCIAERRRGRQRKMQAGEKKL